MTHEEEMITAIARVLPAVVSIVIGQEAGEVEKSIPDSVWREIDEAARNGSTPATHSEIIGHMPKTASGLVRAGVGSGFIVSPEGLILTNKHVIIDPDAEYTVITANEDRYQARILGRDPLNDVAILQIDEKSLAAAELGDSDQVKLGQTAVALGNALGEFQNTASAGIISGLSRFITAASEDAHPEHLGGLIQTDAAINPGNSGGPLINLQGEIIGINSAIAAGAQSIGFAIPINRAKKDLKDLERFGKILRPYLGIRYLPITPYLKKRFALAADRGVFIYGEKIPGHHGVMPESPAAKAGVRERDAIISVNGKPLADTYTLEEILEQAAAGDRLTLEILRGQEPLEVAVTLENRP